MGNGMLLRWVEVSLVPRKLLFARVARFGAL